MTHSNTWRFAKLIALQEEVHPNEFVLESDLCTIGRSPTCQIVIPEKIVSRLHTRIQRDEGYRYILYDSESANGTFVNGHRLHEAYLLRDKDEIGLGQVKPHLRFEDAEATLHLTPTRLHYDKHKMMFSLDQQPLELTPSQFRLLEHLYKHAYDICTRESCAEIVWGREYDPVLDDQALNRVFSNLRNQFQKIAPDLDLIVTHRGLGYMLVLDT
jgi:DNA-binding response OmpR family regulator